MAGGRPLHYDGYSFERILLADRMGAWFGVRLEVFPEFGILEVGSCTFGVGCWDPFGNPAHAKYLEPPKR
jgi:hypothetical protein